MDDPEPTTHTYRGLATALAALSLVGTVASAMLLKTELAYTANPGIEPSCNINALVGCTSSMSSSQGHLFGVPNSVLGVIGYGALTLVMLVALLRGRLPRWMWVGVSAGATLAMIWIVWFLYLSVTVFHTLCPYCMVIWAVTIPVFLLAIAHTLYLYDIRSSFALFLIEQRYLLIVLVYLIVAVVALVGLRDKLVLLF